MQNLSALRQASAFDATEPLRILVAEDEASQRLLLCRTLTKAGYVVDSVEHGADALERVRGGRYAMLVTDWEMPELDGPALCREIRHLPLDHYVYIVMLTGHSRSSDVVHGLEAGADDYVQKTASPAELLARLDAGARIVRLERSLRAATARIELLSLTDPLLPLYNRRFLALQLQKEIERARRYGHALSIVIADIDHFKRVNDAHGHLVGDEVLMAFASLLTGRLRASDVAARYGGEEFVIVLPETDAAGAFAVAEKLRSACATTPVPTTRGHVAITASFGVATFESPDAPPRDAVDRLLRSADDALYRSKIGGRDRVTLAA